MSTPFRYTFRVRYAEIDGQSVVFNSRYLEYADVLITEYWRATGVQQTNLGELEFHVVRAEVDYRAPIRYDELVEGRVWTEKVGRTSIVTCMELHGQANGQGGDDLRAGIRLVNVHVDLDQGTPQPIPEEVRARLEA
ncbi:MAG: acyl-CoA thioesterase [Sphingomonadales bacterium]|nr:acyl-CoA thioesterase [Sphingomonadales bacterium]MDE2567797.1 acyl-CoA thioesterase [Sphingomonadales bacterium]